MDADVCLQSDGVPDSRLQGCPPGTCGQYASTGFEILGLVLMGAAHSNHYYDLDQKSVFKTKELRAKFTETAFPGPGPCRSTTIILGL